MRLSRDTRIVIIMGRLNDVKYDTKEGSLKLSIKHYKILFY
jgi:hypothetical protein